MKGRKGRTGRVKALNIASIRATISFPSELYVTLQGIAKQKKCRSRGWCARLQKSTSRTSGLCLRDRSDVRKSSIFIYGWQEH